MKGKKFILLFYIGCLTLLPILLLVLPADFFDRGESICVSVLFFDIECYGCGMTRAIQHLLHLDFSSASHFNKLSFVVLPLLIYIWLNESKRVIKKIRLYYT